VVLFAFLASHPGPEASTSIPGRSFCDDVNSGLCTDLAKEPTTKPILRCDEPAWCSIQTNPDRAIPVSA
jgi:hypothetical protein